MTDLPDNLNALSPEVIANQATINIGTIGHVAHGKSTVVKAISGVHTVRFKNEIERNITIKLGYANAKLFECPKCTDICRYQSLGSAAPVDSRCAHCSTPMNLLRHVSFVDCPGHDILMATMLNGAAVMDAALLLVAANEPCPQPQTQEHLAAVQIMKLHHIIILQNKIDLVKETQAEEHYQEIIQFIKSTVADRSPIIPVSAQLKYNIDVIVDFLVNFIPVPTRNLVDPARLIVIRSFDINKPGTNIDDLTGGVAGGSILQGILRIGDKIEIRPGLSVRDEEGRVSCKPIFSSVVSLFAEKNSLKYALPGGLIGVGTSMDPSLCRADRLVGGVLGIAGTLPDVYCEIQIHYYLLKRLLGVKATGDDGRSVKVSPLAGDEILMLNIGSTSAGGTVVAVEGNHHATIILQNPVCTEVGAKVALSRRIEKHWRLIGWADVIGGNTVTLTDI
ncbi:hypothetical protein GEMRC1_011949 [Eukaryota sp. GEM-RC1]